MCLPAVPLIALQFAAAAAQAKMQYDGQKAQAEYQDKSNAIAKQQFAVEEDMQRMDGERQAAQDWQQSASEVNAYQAEAMRDRATLETLLGEYGAGNTGDRRMAALGVRQGQDFATLADNASKRQIEMSLGQAATIGATRGKVASLRAGERPSDAGLALSLGTSALQFRSNYLAHTDPFGEIRRKEKAEAEARRAPDAIGQWRRTGTGGD